MHVGLQPLEQPRDGGVGEDDDVVHAAKRRHQLRPAAAARTGRPAPLQPRHRPIVVHGDDQAIGLGGRALRGSARARRAARRSSRWRRRCVRPAARSAATRASSSLGDYVTWINAHASCEPAIRLTSAIRLARPASQDPRSLDRTIPPIGTVRQQWPAAVRRPTRWRCRASSRRCRRRSWPAAPPRRTIAPAASASAIVAITVSPAPVTSAISSLPKIGMWTVGSFGSKSAMPRLPRVTSTAFIRSRRSSVRPARSSTSMSSLMRTPSSCSTSDSFGVQAVSAAVTRPGRTASRPGPAPAAAARDAATARGRWLGQHAA